MTTGDRTQGGAGELLLPPHELLLGAPGIDPIAEALAGRADQLPPEGFLLSARVDHRAGTGEVTVVRYGEYQHGPGLQLIGAHLNAKGESSVYTDVYGESRLDAAVVTARPAAIDIPPPVYGNMLPDEVDLFTLKNKTLALRRTPLLWSQPGHASTRLRSGYNPDTDVTTMHRIAHIDEIPPILETIAAGMNMSRAAGLLFTLGTMTRLEKMEAHHSRKAIEDIQRQLEQITNSRLYRLMGWLGLIK